MSRSKVKKNDKINEDSDDDGQLEYEISEEELERQINKKRRDAANRYLESLKQSSHLASSLYTSPPTLVPSDGEDKVDAAVVDRENIAHRLQQDIRQAQGKIFRHLADELNGLKARVKKVFGYRTANLSRCTPTCLALCEANDKSSAEATVIVGYKSGELRQWDLDTGKLTRVWSPESKKKSNKRQPTGHTGHTGHILCVASSPDCNYIVSGDRNGRICVWSNKVNTITLVDHDTQVNDSKPIALVGSHHRGAITGLTFAKNNTSDGTFFSSSADRTIKIWNVTNQIYIDTLYGHQDEVLAVDAWHGERCISVGARDRTARLWKIPEETQLVFRASSTTSSNNHLDDTTVPEDDNNIDLGGSLEVVAWVDSNHFITGSDAGTLSLWTTHRKKPIFNLPRAHTGSITSLYALALSDVIISGGEDGQVCWWKVDLTNASYKLILLGSLGLEGVINGVAMTDNGRKMAVAVGREGRLGRWTVKSKARNQVVIIDLI